MKCYKSGIIQYAADSIELYVGVGLQIITL